MLTAAAGGGLLGVLATLELALVLVGRGVGDELCDDGAPALELCATLVGADGVCDRVGLPDGVLCARWCAGDVCGAPLVRAGWPPEVGEDC